MRPTDNSNNTTTPEPPYTWLDALFMLVQSPEPKTMKRILADKAMPAQRAYLWVLISGIFLGIALAGVHRPSELINALLIGSPLLSVDTSSYQPDFVTIVLVGVSIGSMYSVVGFIIQTWLLQRMSGYFAPKRAYRDIVVLRGVYYPVILVMRALIIAILSYNSLAANILILGTFLLDFSLTTLVLVQRSTSQGKV